MALAVRARRQRSARRPSDERRTTPHGLYGRREFSRCVAEGRRSDRGALAVPSGTTVEEHDLVTDGDVLVGSQSTVEFGLRGRNVALGERVSVENDIEARGRLPARHVVFRRRQRPRRRGRVPRRAGDRHRSTDGLRRPRHRRRRDDRGGVRGERVDRHPQPRPHPRLLLHRPLSSCGSARPTRPTTWRRRSPTAKTCVTPAGPA